MTTKYEIRLPEELAELLRGLHPDLKARFKSALAILIADPYRGKALREELAGLRSFRIKRMRIVYRVAVQQVIEVVAIGPRRTIYEETFRIISRKAKVNP